MQPYPTFQLHDAIVDLFHDTISRFPPTHAPDVRALAPATVGRLGDYLVQLGYLTPRQRERALLLAARPLPHGAVPLGCRLVAQDLVPAPVVIAIVLQQFLERLTLDPRHATRFLGEQLLLEAHLEVEQLANVLHEQLIGYQQGRWTRLGELIVQHGWLDAATITDSVYRQAARLN
jgi:hypothetical protein